MDWIEKSANLLSGSIIDYRMQALDHINQYLLRGYFDGERGILMPRLMRLLAVSWEMQGKITLPICTLCGRRWGRWKNRGKSSIKIYISVLIKTKREPVMVWIFTGWILVTDSQNIKSNSKINQAYMMMLFKAIVRK